MSGARRNKRSGPATAIALLGDPAVRRAAAQAAPPAARLAIAVARHLVRERAVELGLIRRPRRRRRAALYLAGAAGTAGLAIYLGRRTAS